MIYMVLAFDDRDFDTTPYADTSDKREKLVSKRVSWDSPVATVEVHMRNLRKGLNEHQKERLGL